MPWVSVEKPSKELLNRIYLKSIKDSHKRLCPDCGVKKEEKHHINCDVARCLKCGGQKLSCGCRGGYGDVWEGMWPGTKECWKKKYVAIWVGGGPFDSGEPIFDYTRLAAEKMKPSVNQIAQHIPSFIDLGKKPKVSKFKTVEDLVKIPWVKSFSEDPKFYRYSIADESLMAEYKKGKEWWVVGNIKNPASVDLPKWVSR
jgi:hypothetical protein